MDAVVDTVVDAVDDDVAVCGPRYAPFIYLFQLDLRSADNDDENDFISAASIQ